MEVGLFESGQGAQVDRVIPETHLVRKGGISVSEKTWAFPEN